MKKNILLFSFVLSLVHSIATANEGYPYAGIVKIETQLNFETLCKKLENAIEDTGMVVVTRASASDGNKDGELAGNGVIGVFRNDFAVRLLALSIPAGIEAPIRFYITENKDKTATLTYRRPTAILEPYSNASLSELAEELDVIFDQIAKQATL